MAGTMVSMQIVGRLVRDAELKYLQSGQPVLHFCTVTDRKTKVKDEWVELPSFWECDLWGKRGETLHQYLVKGKMVALSGAPYIHTWDHEGIKRQRVKLDVIEISMLGGRNQESQAEEPPKTASPPPKYNDPDRWADSDPRGKRESQAQAPDELGLFNDDIPF
jgi:single-strand DNA-binding protein